MRRVRPVSHVSTLLYLTWQRMLYWALLEEIINKMQR